MTWLPFRGALLGKLIQKLLTRFGDERPSQRIFPVPRQGNRHEVSSRSYGFELPEAVPVVGFTQSKCERIPGNAGQPAMIENHAGSRLSVFEPAIAQQFPRPVFMLPPERMVDH